MSKRTELTRGIVLLSFLASLFLVAPAEAAPAYVQGLFGVGTGCNGSSSTGCVATFTASNTVAGNTIVACADWGSTGVHVTSVVDTTISQTFSDSGAGEVTYNSGGANALQCFYLPNITGGTKDVITLTLASSASFPNLFIMEISGVSATAPVDKFCSGTGTGTAIVTSTCATTTNANEILVGFGATNAANGLTAGSGYTIPAALSRGNDSMEYQVVSSTGAYTASMTGAGSAPWGIILVTFSPIGAAPRAVPHHSHIF